MKSDAAPFRVLRWRRWFASGLLVLMVALLFGTLGFGVRGFWVGLAQAGAEAALAGGLADWFAVTALFRRPLGLPIPHTAIVPSNKDRIGAGLAAFVQDNFLTRDTIAAALRSIDPAANMAAWLISPSNARAAAEQILSQAPSIIEFADTRAIRAHVSTALQERLLEADLRPLLHIAAEAFAAAGLHAKLVDDALDAARDFLERKGDRFEELIANRSRGWMRSMVDRRVSRAIIEGLQELVGDLCDPESLARKRLLTLMEERARIVIASTEEAEALAAAVSHFIAEPRAQIWLSEFLKDLRGFALDNSTSFGRDAHATLAELLRAVGGALLADAELRQKFDAALGTVALQATPLQQELAKLVGDIVREWDAGEFADRIEQAVDDDLQFIRINGTVVGGIVGCLLYLAKAPLLQ